MLSQVVIATLSTDDNKALPRNKTLAFINQYNVINAMMKLLNQNSSNLI